MSKNSCPAASKPPKTSSIVRRRGRFISFFGENAKNTETPRSLLRSRGSLDLPKGLKKLRKNQRWFCGRMSGGKGTFALQISVMQF